MLAVRMSRQTFNPSFPVTRGQAQTLLKEMQACPVVLQRPVVVLGGWLDVLAARGLASRLRKVTGDARVISVSFATAKTFDQCRERVIQAVDEAFGLSPGEATTGVDTIGFSMGGLVARYAAAPTASRRHLRIVRLFTISTPHQGANLARLPMLNRLQKAMRCGSDFLRRVASEKPEYPICCYVRLGDVMVGTANAAPRGSGVWWVDRPPLERAHASAWRDPRIVADIARRLRGETPLTVGSPSPLPDRRRRKR